MIFNKGGRGLGKTRELTNKLEEELSHKDSIINYERRTKEFYHDSYKKALYENRCFKNEIDGLNRIIEETEKEKEELNNKFEDLSEKYKAKKKACDYWFDKYTLNQEKLNKIFEEIKKLTNLIEKLNIEKDMNIYSLDNYEERISELDWLNDLFLMIIHDCCQSEDEIIIQYLDKKLNLLIDQNAPECMKTLIQNLIDELIVNK